MVIVAWSASAALVSKPALALSIAFQNFVANFVNRRRGYKKAIINLINPVHRCPCLATLMRSGRPAVSRAYGLPCARVRRAALAAGLPADGFL
jgi:hypothetical protein